MTKRTYRTQQSVREPAERGAVLVSSLLALGLITLLGLALTGTDIEAVTITTNDREVTETTEVFYIADAGIVHAQALLAGVTDFNPILQAGNGTPCDGDELSTQPIDPIPAASAGGQPFPPGGRYELQVCQDALGRILVISTGYGRDGATVTLEIMINPAVPLPAILVEGNLRVNGNPTVTGNAGAISWRECRGADFNDPCGVL